MYFYPEIVHTPMVSFSIRRIDAACGIMITASHNPKEDNGYKLYWKNGSQIIPPHDSMITKSILDNLEPKSWDIDENESLIINLGTEMTHSYFKECRKYAIEFHIAKNLNFCYTAMHGVGLKYAKEIFKSFNLPEFNPVEEQVLISHVLIHI